MIISRQISALLILILVLFLVVILLSTPRTENIYENQVYLYPNILKKMGRVSNIDIKQNHKILSFNKNHNGEWKIVSNENFPARINLINDLLLGITYLKIVEKKTKDPKMYALLQVEDYKKKSSNATAVILKDVHNKVLVNLLVGKKQTSPNFSGKVEQIYVRKKGDKQSWLVEGNLPSSLEFKDWVTQPLLPISVNDINKLTISNIHTKPKSPLVFYKNNIEDTFFYKKNSTSNSKEKMAIEKNNTLVYLLSNLEYKYAASYSEFENLWKPTLKIEIDTIQASKIKLEFAKLNKHIYARILSDTNSSSSSTQNKKNSAFKSLEENNLWIFEVTEDIYNLANSTPQDLVKALKS